VTVRLGSHHAATADLSPVVERGIVTATGVCAEVSASRLITATDVFATVVDFTVTAVVRGVLVNLRPTAGRVGPVVLVADTVARTAEMRMRVIYNSIAAAGVIRHQLLNTLATCVESLVVNHAVTAACVLTVLACTYTVPRPRRHRVGSASF